MKLIDRSGQKFGKLVVLAQAGRNELKKVLWKCRCDCGNEINVSCYRKYYIMRVYNS
jgi:hypothetical protein